MIKKTLGFLILGIFGLGLNSFVNGVDIQRYYLNTPATIIDRTQQNDFELKNNTNFLLNDQYKIYSWQQPQNNYNYLTNIFWYNGKLYGILSNGNGNNNINTKIITQGYLEKGCIIDKTENMTAYTWGYCDGMDFDLETLYYSGTDYSNPDELDVFTSGGSGIGICFIYEEKQKVICTIFGYIYSSRLGESENFTYNPLGEQIGTSFDLSNLALISENSPFNGGGNNEQIQQIRTGQNYYCPTFRQLLSTYPSNYSTGICYNGTLKYENGQLTTVQKQDIFTVFTDYEEYQQYVYLYNNYCTGPATQTACENAFNGEREKYSIISNAYNKNVDDKKIWQYCDMALNYDLNTTTCTAGTGSLENIGQAPTPENLKDLIEQLNNIGNIQTPITGNILNNLLEDGQTREDISPRNILGNLDQIKDKLSNIFEERTGTTGVIPDYIMWLILVSLLLTVLLKK